MNTKKPVFVCGITLVLTVVGLMASMPATAQEGGLASGKVRAPAANLEVEILESNSYFVNYIYLVSPGPEVFIGSDDATGTVVTLPPVMPNEELIFEIRVFEPDGTDTGTRWQSGPPARNTDHKQHVQLSAPAADQIQVNFEDIHGDGWGVADEPNFVDAVFVVRPAP